MTILAPRSDHGTRACYVAGCRCASCRRANTDRHHRRRAEIAAAASTVTPSGPAIAGTMRRGGRDCQVKRCPGANGAPCVKGGTWLRGPHAVCGTCVERATVWDGLVPCERSRKHLMKLRRAGIGYKAVSAASDVARTTLMEILTGSGPIRASTERRILAIDEGARADGALVRADRANRLIARMRARGFTKRHLAVLLGSRAKVCSLQLGDRTRMTAKTRQRIERLWNRIERGEIEPNRFLVEGALERAWLVDLIERGAPSAWLSRCLGFEVTRERLAELRRLKSVQVEAIRSLQRGVKALLREDVDGNSESWPWWTMPEFAAALGIDRVRQECA